jgi:hypothetical protein
VEASLTFPDGSLDQKEIDPVKAIALLVEEIKLLPTYGVNAIITTKAQLDETSGRLGTLE